MIGEFLERMSISRGHCLYRSNEIAMPYDAGCVEVWKESRGRDTGVRRGTVASDGLKLL